MSDVLEFMVPSRARAKKNWDEGRSVVILAMNNCKTGRCGPLSASASSGRGSEIPHVRPSRWWSRHRRRVLGFRTLSSDSPCTYPRVPFKESRKSFPGSTSAFLPRSPIWSLNLGAATLTVGIFPSGARIPSLWKCNILVLWRMHLRQPKTVVGGIHMPEGALR